MITYGRLFFVRILFCYIHLWCKLKILLLPQFWEAVKICMDQTVEITEDLSEKLTPDKDWDPDPMARLKILEAIAEVCMHQGAYHLATKKFTQAGNKIKVGLPVCLDVWFVFLYLVPNNRTGQMGKSICQISMTLH